MALQGFTYSNGEMHCEAVPLSLLAGQFGTPAYVYSSAAILENYRAYRRSLAAVPHEVHFAVKANSSLGVLARLAAEGAGFDIVSGGELFRVLRAGGEASKVVFSGVGKTRGEIAYALDAGVGWFNCESEDELLLLRQTATDEGYSPRVALRVNPDINAETHPYIATGLRAHKFGIAMEQAEALYLRSREFAPLRFEGVSCHIGSQIFDTGVFFEALEKVLAMIRRLQEAAVTLSNLDLGGGLGVAYEQGVESPSVEAFGERLAKALQGSGLRLMLEPGRSIAGQAGVLLTRVLYRKPAGGKVFLIVDAAMNDLIRPALYQSHHEILPVKRCGRPEVLADVVGPVCETGDFLARDRHMPDAAAGDLLAVGTAGAYGFVLSSNYNSRPRAAEVLIEGERAFLIRRRETYEDLIRGESAELG